MSYERGFEFWIPELLFSGETVFVVGGGPSLRGFDFEQLRDRRSIVCNTVGLDMPWADILVFHDYSWYSVNSYMTLVMDWNGRVVTPSRKVKTEIPDRVLRVHLEPMLSFTVGTSPMREGRCTGQTAVSLAVSMGAKRVIMIGFDMRNVEGQSHYHQNRPLYDERHAAKMDANHPVLFLPYWQGWYGDALRVGCEIFNATPGSALKEFPEIDIERALQDG